MDFKKIFIKGACPTSIGGQAIMSGIMMRGPYRTATAIRLHDGTIHLKTEPTPKVPKAGQIPFIRGVVNFVMALVNGTKILMDSADVLEKDEPENYEPDKFDQWIEKKFGKEKGWNILLTLSVIIALVLSIGIFILLPTVIVGALSSVVDSVFVLNLIEGGFRILLFIIYVFAISKIKDIHEVFQYHGAEHKTIHCFENNLELTPENAQTFYTLHPRCGTSFLMFVMIIAVLIHALMGWPNMWMRILTRILVLPVIAGISYELLRWAGRSDNAVVRFLSLPGIYLQKLTTATPNNEQLEVAIVALKAVLPKEDEESIPFFTKIVDKDGNEIENK